MARLPPRRDDHGRTRWRSAPPRWTRQAPIGVPEESPLSTRGGGTPAISTPWPGACASCHTGVTSKEDATPARRPFQPPLVCREGIRPRSGVASGRAGAVVLPERRDTLRHG